MGTRLDHMIGCAADRAQEGHQLFGVLCGDAAFGQPFGQPNLLPSQRQLPGDKNGIDAHHGRQAGNYAEGRDHDQRRQKQHGTGSALAGDALDGANGHGFAGVEPLLHLAHQLTQCPFLRRFHGKLLPTRNARHGGVFRRTA